MPATCVSVGAHDSPAASSAVPSGRAGLTLDLHIHQPGRGWPRFAKTRTQKNGHFGVGYRFNSAKSGRFTLRLRLRPNDAYPYARGVSCRVHLRVG
jgi:hypothetical protein